MAPEASLVPSQHYPFAPMERSLIAQLPPGEDNSCAMGHAEPVGLFLEAEKWGIEAKKQAQCHTLTFPFAEI